MCTFNPSINNLFHIVPYQKLHFLTKTYTLHVSLHIFPAIIQAAEYCRYSIKHQIIIQSTFFYLRLRLSHDCGCVPLYWVVPYPRYSLHHPGQYGGPQRVHQNLILQQTIQQQAHAVLGTHVLQHRHIGSPTETKIPIKFHQR